MLSFGFSFCNILIFQLSKVHFEPEIVKKERFFGLTPKRDMPHLILSIYFLRFSK